MAPTKCFFPFKRSTNHFSEAVHEKLGKCQPELSCCSSFASIFNSKKLEKNLKEITYILSNGVTSESVSYAAQEFMEREFPHFLQDGFRGVEFVPEIFFSKLPYVIEMDENKWTSDQTEQLKNQSGFIKGDKSEYCLFNKIQETFCSKTNETKDDDDAVLVIHGFKSTDADEEGETDFVIVSKQRKHIYIIESKDSKHKAIKNVVDQLKRVKNYLQKYFGAFLKGWKIILCVYFHINNPALEFCDNCEPFVLTEDTNFAEWWTNQNVKRTDSDSESWKDLFKFLIFSQHAHKEPVSKADTTNKLHKVITTKVGAVNNIFLWSKKQLSIFKNSQEATKVIISGPFVSGKTIILKEKAKEVATKLNKINEVTKNVFETVHFLTLRQMFSSNISLLKKTEKNFQTNLLQTELKGYGIKVRFFWSFLNLYNYLEKQPLQDHIFLDEFSLSFPSQVYKLRIISKIRTLKCASKMSISKLKSSITSNLNVIGLSRLHIKLT
jgi:hypothetical protein